jgi:hypothetical protein
MKHFYIFASLLGALSITTTQVFALSVSLEQENKTYLKGEHFIVHARVSTENQSINAFESRLVFSDDKVELIDVQDGNSLITFWLEKPVPGTKGDSAISGIIPGGYLADNAYLASFIFKAKESGDISIALKENKAILNKEEIKTVYAKDTQINGEILKEATTTVRAFINEIEDKNPPEIFKPEISQDKELFGGKYFIVFATQDKGSGVDRFEIREGRKEDFVIAESPYILSDQTLNSVIYIKAYDKKGNVREQVVYGPNWKPWYQNTWFVLTILLLVLVISLVVVKILHKRKHG